MKVIKNTITPLELKNIEEAYNEYNEREFHGDFDGAYEYATIETDSILYTGFSSFEEDDYYEIQCSYDLVTLTDVTEIYNETKEIIAKQVVPVDVETILINLRTSSYDDFVTTLNHNMEYEDLQLFLRFYRNAPSEEMVKNINTLSKVFNYTVEFDDEAILKDSQNNVVRFEELEVFERYYDNDYIVEFDDEVILKDSQNNVVRFEELEAFERYYDNDSSLNVIIDAIISTMGFELDYNNFPYNEDGE